MDIRPTLTMAQKQVLVMTPRLQQAIKILQMPRLELSQYITQQMNENFILEETSEEVEIESKDDELEELIGIPESDVDLETGLPETDSVTKDDMPELDIADEDFGDINWKEYFEDNGTGSIEWEEPQEDRRDNSALEESLQDHLLWQLRLSVNSDNDY